MKYLYDNMGHLICVPYSIENLHTMARELEIPKPWFHRKENRHHYDIPSYKLDLVKENAELVSPKVILTLLKEHYGK